MNYEIQVNDKATHTGTPAIIIWLDASGQPQLLSGAPIAVDTNPSGYYQFTANAQTIKVRISATGYVSQDIDLAPGLNKIELDGVQGPTATITAQARTMFEKLKPVLILIAILAAILAAIKYKLIK